MVEVIFRFLFLLKTMILGERWTWTPVNTSDKWVDACCVPVEVDFWVPDETTNS
jgi:hypothetical protein